MRRLVVLGFMVVLGATTAQAERSSCKDQFAHALNFGIPRTALDDKSAERLPLMLANLVQPMYRDPCEKGKSLQINLAFGSDYEVLDWLERGRIDGGIVPDLSLWLLKHDVNPLLELNPDAASHVEILRPRAATPKCRHYLAGNATECVASAEYSTLLADIIRTGKAGKRRVMFASHLSSTGFLDPIEQAFAAFSKIEAKIDAKVDEKLREQLREQRWVQLFDAAYFAIDSDPKLDPFAFVVEEEKQKTPLRPVPPELIVISFPGEETVAREADAKPPVALTGHPYREHVVLSSSAATFFREGSFVALPAGTTLRTAAFEKMLSEKHPPRPLEVIAQGDRASGVRGYTFTINESLRLIAQQQRSSGEADLALVLPGGGVKAAYQSKIVDHLYRHAHLRNTELGAKPGALEVLSVLGTSGGALLGFFVSQLGERGPFNLANILWAPNGETLQSKDVFATTDMLRYLSIVWTFLLFCIVLALVTGTHTSNFYGRTVTPAGSWRWRLTTVAIVFFAVPLLIRFVTGGDDIEHVPVIEGIFYTILTVLVMFCDQCLVYSKDDNETRPLTMHILLLASLGTLFVTASMTGAQPNDALQEPVAIGLAFATLSIMFLGSPLLLLYASGRFGDVRRRLLDVLGSLIAVLLLAASGVHLPNEIELTFRSIVFTIPMHAIGGVFALLMLLGLAVYTYWYAHLPKRKPIVGTLLTFLTLIATAVLCWPAADSSEGLVGWGFLTEDAMETTRLAPFLASTGCLLLVIAAIVWVYQRREYSLHDADDFSIGLALLLLHALLSAGVVLVVAQQRPGFVHNVEMTKSFWVALTIVGLLLAALLLRLTRHFSILRRAVRFLTSEHPNGSLVPRRYARMLGIVGISLVWWNGIVAPALYGNDAARKYLERAVKNFDREFRSVNRERSTGDARGFIPTAKFVVPTNTLDDADATRYFLFLTQGEAQLDLPRRSAGAAWQVYKTSARRAAKRNCQKIIDPGCAAFVQDVIFSSGSPFPIFAAHRVMIPGEEEKLGLIDGGYSNDIPIDAARTIAARQVLVVHSSRAPAEEPHEHAERSTIPFAAGMLIRNAERLPAFMFERGQQADRMSRQNLFVVGLAPLLARGEPWPGLAQFDAPTVQEMLRKGKSDLCARIGFAESWGEPRIRFSQQVAPTNPPATKTNRGGLPRVASAAH